MQRYGNIRSTLCPVCGIEFAITTRWPKQKYCSATCFHSRVPRMTDAEKLWRHVEKTPTCWLWQASVNRGGYGNLTIKTDKGWHGVLAHRLAYRLAFGDIPAGLFVCHKCDTPRCVRNDGQNSHLFLGTSAENTMDCVNKGRIASGEMLPSAAFSDAMALKLLHEFAATGGTIAALARRHDVHPATMRHLIRRETYRHLDF